MAIHLLPYHLISHLVNIEKFKIEYLIFLITFMIYNLCTREKAEGGEEIDAWAKPTLTSRLHICSMRKLKVHKPIFKICWVGNMAHGPSKSIYLSNHGISSMGLYKLTTSQLCYYIKSNRIIYYDYSLKHWKCGFPQARF